MATSTTSTAGAPGGVGAMSASDLAEFERLCERAYTSTDAEARSSAERALTAAVGQPSWTGASQCIFLLQNTGSGYAVLFAVSTLHRYTKESWNTFTSSQRNDIQMCVLNFLAKQGPSLPNYLLKSCVQLVSMICKVGWFDDPAHPPQTVPQIKTFLEATPAHCPIGLVLLTGLVYEIGSHDQSQMTLAQHRKIAIAFRDQFLLDIFQIGINLLKRIRQSPERAANNLKEETLKLIIQCLSFDFIGTTPDESNDDLGTIQIPAAWRPHFEDPELLPLFLHTYTNTTPPSSTQTLECMVLIASVRRSLFPHETERAKFLNSLLRTSEAIIHHSAGLQDQGNHHVFCRLLAILKTNYQLQALIAAEGWQDWLKLVADFTLTSLKAWQWSPNSVHYLMQFWHKTVTSIGYLPSSARPALVDAYAPKIVQAYMTSQLERVSAFLSGQVEDALSNEDAVSEMLEFVAPLGRCKYDEFSKFLTALFDQSIPIFEGMLAKPPGDPQLSLIQGQLAWLIFAVGSLISGRMTMSVSQEHDMRDGDLATRVFHVQKLCDTRLSRLQGFTFPKESFDCKLEYAFLYFTQQFRRMYIGDHALTSSKVYDRMNELIGLSNHQVVLQLLLTKILNNLKFWKDFSGVIQRSLSLFFDICSGYSSSKYIAKLDMIDQLLSHHTSEYIPFLSSNTGSKGGKYRTTYYSILGRILFMDELAPRFDLFMIPFEQQINTLLAQPSIESLRQEQFMPSVIGLLYDLAGIAASIQRKLFPVFFDWLSPQFTPILCRIAEAYWDMPTVTVPLVKFVGELVWNKFGRLQFESFSANGILLFKEASKVIITLGSRLAHLNPRKDVYIERYKPIVLILNALTHALGGDYVNFGVFSIYNDTCLTDSVMLSTKLALSIPLSDLLAYPKFMKIYFAFLDVICNNHVLLVYNLEPQLFFSLVSSLEPGLSSTDVQIVTNCCTTLDHLLSAYLTHRRNADKLKAAPSSSSQHLRSSAALAPLMESRLAPLFEVFCRIVSLFFQTLLSFDSGHQYGITKTLFPLILVAPKAYEDTKARLIGAQPQQDQRDKLQQEFTKLSAEIEPSIEYKAREKFSQAMVAFAHAVKPFAAKLL
ncbi:Nuclear transport receptor RanBP16 [Pelomyxa schiedti]|nr:Nuclear transport receptor RanBP16 [Pelomyxa schiedti]